MSETQKIRMLTSIAGHDELGKTFGFQPGQVVTVASRQAKAWISSGHAERVDANTPVTPPDSFNDLTAEEALRHLCLHCERRAEFVLRNQPFCARHFRAEMES